jgi:transcriptional regulator with XRE-family HTH domain
MKQRCCTEGKVMKNIRELRNLADWSQFQLATATGIDRTRLSLIENGHVIPDLDERLTIEQALLAEIARRSDDFNAVLGRVSA